MANWQSDSFGELEVENKYVGFGVLPAGIVLLGSGEPTLLGHQGSFENVLRIMTIQTIIDSGVL